VENALGRTAVAAITGSAAPAAAAASWRSEPAGKAEAGREESSYRRLLLERFALVRVGRG
jgi:hypothetical protein